MKKCFLSKHSGPSKALMPWFNTNWSVCVCDKRAVIWHVTEIFLFIFLSFSFVKNADDNNNTIGDRNERRSEAWKRRCPSVSSSSRGLLTTSNFHLESINSLRQFLWVWQVIHIDKSSSSPLWTSSLIFFPSPKDTTRATNKAQKIILLW